MIRCLRGGLLAAAFLIVASLSFADSSTSLTGRVLGPDGQPAAGARVTLRAVTTGAQVTTVTRDDGRYSVSGLPDGAYVIDAQWRGALRASARQIDLPAASLDLTLDRAAYEEQVVVTAENRPQPATEVGKAITIVDREALDRQAFPSLGDTLMRTPGVQVLNSGGPGQLTQVRIRGVRVEGAGILIDGLRFRDASSTQGDPTQFMANFPLVDPDRIEILRGSASSLYGTNAVGGVVNIVSRTGREEPGGDLQVDGGQLGLFRTRATVDGQAAGDRIHFSAGALRMNLADGIDGHDASDATAGQASVSARLTPKTIVTGRLLAMKDASDLNSSPGTTEIPAANLGNGSIVRARALPAGQLRRLVAGQSVDYGDATYIPDRDDPDSRRHSQFYTAALTATHTIGTRVSLRGTYQRVHTNRVFDDGPLGAGFQPLGQDFTEYWGDTDTAELRATVDLRPDLSVTGGYEFERESFRQGQDNHLSGLDHVAVDTRIRQNAHAVFAQASWRAPDQRLSITGATRAQGFRLSHPSFDFNGTANVYDVPLDAPPAAVTGDAAVAYVLTPGGETKLRAHVGNAYRAPSLFERFGAGFFGDAFSGMVIFSPYGDPYLKPDRYVSVDAGVDQTWWRGRAALHATYFHTRIQQLTAFDFSGAIDAATDPYGRFGGYINGDGGRSRGVELSGAIQATPSLTVLSSYTFTDTKMDKDASVTGFFGTFGIARHTASVSAIQRIGERIDLQADLFARSASYGALFATDRSRAFEYPGYARVDLLAGYRVPLARLRQLRLYGRVDNLFDVRYYELGWLTPGARFTGGVIIKY
jgi:iron complex outermembrane receptor protein